MIPALLEQFTAADHMRVRRILNLDPTRRRAVRLVSTLAQVGDDTLEVTLAGPGEQIAAASLERIDVQQTGVDPRHDRAQAALAFDQRAIPEVLAVDAEHIERVEVRPLAAKQQLMKVAPTIGVEQTRSPSRTASIARRLWAISSASTSHFVKRGRGERRAGIGAPQ
jgi:hypothetical protein